MGKLLGIFLMLLFILLLIALFGGSYFSVKADIYACKTEFKDVPLRICLLSSKYRVVNHE